MKDLPCLGSDQVYQTQKVKRQNMTIRFIIQILWEFHHYLLAIKQIRAQNLDLA